MKQLSFLLLVALLPSPLEAAEQNLTGEQLFRNNCMACHQETGLGIANVYPALAGSEVVTGSADDVALVVLIGRGAMPSFKGSLSDSSLTAIINYVRNAWGNIGGPISTERVTILAATVD